MENKDIKSLYLTAKSTGFESDINGYIECVNELASNKPYDYILNLEYIISSDIGLATLKPFIETKGISLLSYDIILEKLEEARLKCYKKALSEKVYKEAIEMMESFKKKYHHNFIVFEGTINEQFEKELYLRQYYERTTPLLDNIHRLYSRHGLAIVPDIVIECVKNKTIDSLLKLFETSNNLSSESFQWIIESLKDFSIQNNDSIKAITEKSLDGIVSNARNRANQIFREAVLTGNDNLMIEYTENEIMAMENLISFKEYVLTCLESTEEMLETQNQIYTLYEELAPFIQEDIADSVIPMLPTAQSSADINKTESFWGSSTTDKKKGVIPAYLRKHHAMDYGEEEDKKKQDEEDEKDIEDYKRPSASDDKDDSKYDKDSPDTKELTPEEKKQAVNNYYYYSYNNSFNKDKSQHHKSVDNSKSSHDDHSVHHKSVDNSRRIHDDHSTGKRTHSDNIERNSRNRNVNIEAMEITEDSSLYLEDREVFHYTYRMVKATDGYFYLITFDIDGPGVVNYKLHYPDATEDTVKYVGTIPGAFLKRYGSDNYVSRGNKILSIKNVKTGKYVQSIIASGAVPAGGKNSDTVGVTEIEYSVGGVSPLCYKTTIPIYPMLGDAQTPFGNMKGLNVDPRLKSILNPFLARRLDFSKPIQYKDRYAQLGIILKDTLLEYKNIITSYKKRSVNEIENEIDQRLRAHNLFEDYKISPLSPEEYKSIVAKSAIFVKNCAMNIGMEPWKSLPNFYAGLIVGFFGPSNGPQYINLDIMYRITSGKYNAPSTIFQNVSDWITILLNTGIQLWKVPKEKVKDYYNQTKNVKITIRDIFRAQKFIFVCRLFVKQSNSVKSVCIFASSV
jgi:hypothetical protein